jgi:hypothetical protein
MSESERLGRICCMFNLLHVSCYFVVGRACDIFGVYILGF